jgi:peptidoglycan/xylan/chitin deacetylase (PgdA/CDA1 family)
MTSYTNGDAKWFANPVTVTPGTQYTYSDYYQSNVTTRYVVRYISSTGANTYQELATAPASSTWVQGVRTFTPPTGTQQATVFHLISAVGALTTDDASLTYEVASTPPPPPVSSNLVPNPSLESATGTPATPLSWLSNKWGTNTVAFSYETNGHTGTRSVKATVSGYANGDAKWYFQPIAVQPNKSYDISDFYKSTVPTKLVLVTYDAAGTPTYADVATSVPASPTAWAEVKNTITTPANAATLSIFHLIDANGSLQLDDMTVVPSAATPPPSSTNPIANPSLETEATTTTPAQWVSNSWGTNSASFQYVKTDGHAGAKSAKVTISGYVDGDSKWYPQPFALTKGAQYRFTIWYKTNAQPQATVMFVRADGSQYFTTLPMPLPAAGASTTWQQYTGTFMVPSDAVSVSPFLFLGQNGFLQIDDAKVEPYTPVGFTRPLVTLTFDDGHENNTDTALPIMQARNVKSTQCYATQFVQGDTTAQANVLKFKNAGHEICSHTITHPFLSQVSATQLTNEVLQSRDYLRTLTATPVNNFASPYGDYNQAVITELKKYYRSHRTVDEGYNSKDSTDVYRVRVQNMHSNTTLAQYQSWLDQAKATNTWLVLVYHRVTPAGATDTGEFDTRVEDFVPQVDKVVASGITVKTYNDALDEIMPQLP